MDISLPGIVEEIDWDYYKCVLPIPTDQFTFSPDMEQKSGIYLKTILKLII